MRIVFKKSGLGCAALLGAMAALYMGCDGGGGDTTIRNVGLIVQGFYVGDPSGTDLVRDNTGSPISTLDLRQDGDHIQGVDNNGNIFQGTLGQVGDTSASFNLEGFTTAGAKGTMVGTIEVSGTSATMRGTWAEPALFSTIAGVATVPQPQTNTTAVAITTAPSSMTSGSASSFAATGSGTLTWDDGGFPGSFSPTTGTSVSYTPTATGTVTVTVSNGSTQDSRTIPVN